MGGAGDPVSVSVLVTVLVLVQRLAISGIVSHR
jgi:hypothetical protein